MKFSWAKAFPTGVYIKSVPHCCGIGSNMARITETLSKSHTFHVLFYTRVIKLLVYKTPVVMLYMDCIIYYFMT